MLKKPERISRKTFNEAFTRSKVVSRGSFFVVKMAQSLIFQGSVVVSKKVAKKATERNYIKRVVYNLLSEYKKKNPSLVGIHIIIVQKKPIQYSDLLSEFNTQFK